LGLLGWPVPILTASALRGKSAVDRPRASRRQRGNLRIDVASRFCFLAFCFAADWMPLWSNGWL